MVDRVFVHIGLPKTATSYLQTIIWSNREQLRERGRRRARDGAPRPPVGVAHGPRAGQPRTARRSSHRTAWSRIRAELAPRRRHRPDQPRVLRRGVGGAGRRPMVEALGPAEVHLVVTAREPLGLFTASWQESLKNGSTTPMPDYARRVSNRPTDIWNWRTLDLRLVLERWTRPCRPSGSTSLVLDPGAPRDDVWHRFAGIVGLPDRRHRPVRVVPEHLDGRRRGRDAAPGQRPARPASTTPSTRASTSAPSSPTSGWSRAAASGSGPSRTRSRSAAAAGDEAVDYLAAHARRRRRRPRAPAGPGGARAAPEHPRR